MVRLPPKDLSKARSLRRKMTDAEILLWSKLRDRQIGDAKFRRQVPFDRYIADFLCKEHRLVIEVDGGQHADSAGDKVRDQAMIASGYRVLRFWNNDVLGNIEGVIEAIRQALLSGP